MLTLGCAQAKDVGMDRIADGLPVYIAGLLDFRSQFRLSESRFQNRFQRQLECGRGGILGVLPLTVRF